MPIKFSFEGGILGFLGGGKCRFIFTGAGISLIFFPARETLYDRPQKWTQQRPTLVTSIFKVSGWSLAGLFFSVFLPGTSWETSMGVSQEGCLCNNSRVSLFEMPSVVLRFILLWYCKLLL